MAGRRHTPLTDAQRVALFLKRGESYKAVAKRCGVHHATVMRAIGGVARKPSMPLAEALAAHLGVTIARAFPALAA